MQVTDIKQQVKRQDRYSIFVDSKYAFSLSENELMNSGLRIGREYTQPELDELVQTAVLDKAYMRALDLLSRRARSEWELRDYLRRKDYDQEVINSTMSRLEKAGYVDDLAFARAWIDNRRLLKSISRRKLWQELKQKRIADDIIEEALAEDETDEAKVLQDLIAKKRQQSRYQDKEKLLAFLMRQGYQYDDVRSAMAELD